MLSTDILDYKLGEDDDLVLGPDGFEVVRGLEGIGQLCSIAAKLFLAEWFLDLTKGVDWFTMFQGKFSAANVQSQLRAAWSRVPGVVEVVAIRATIDASARAARVRGTVRGELGDVEVDASIPGGSSG